MASKTSAPTPTSGVDRGEATKRMILSVAGRLFAERGYAGTSLNDIVRECGLTKGAVYFHFSSKEALALEVFQDMHTRMTERLLETASSHERAIDQMAAMLLDRCALLEHERSFRSMGKLCGDLGRDPDLAPHMQQMMHMPVDLMTSLISTAQEQGDVRADLDAHALAEICFAVVIGMDQMSETLSGGADLRRRADAFLDFFMKVVTPVGGRSRG